MFALVLLSFWLPSECSKSMLEMWGAPTGTFYALNASEYSWEQCMIACYKMNDCVLAAENATYIGCNLFTYYNVTTVSKTSPYTTKVAFKMEVPNDLCPESTDPPLFGNSIAYCNVINPNSEAPSAYHQWDYTVTEPSTGSWSLTYYPCYNEETPISIGNVTYCILALSVQANISSAISSCEYKNGTVVGPLTEDQFTAMRDVAALSGNTFWTSGTLNDTCAAEYSSGGCSSSSLFTASGSKIVGTYASNYPCSGGSCEDCLAISSSGLKDVACTDNFYVMCLSKAYTVSGKAVIL